MFSDLFVDTKHYLPDGFNNFAQLGFKLLNVLRNLFLVRKLFGFGRGRFLFCLDFGFGQIFFNSEFCDACDQIQR
ncbi:hypothetical protein D3C87_2112560 [compost metagenome]